MAGMTTYAPSAIPRPIVPGEPTFVLSGGGNLGALQVGMLKALVEHGIRPGQIVGTSIGAINGAFFAGRPDLDGIDEIATLWRSLRRRHILRVRAGTLVRGLAGVSDHLFDSVALREILRRFLTFTRLEEAPIPLAVVATDVATKEPVLLRRGDATTALLASSAVPRVLPAVRIGGRTLVDGAAVADAPLLEAVALGAREIVVLATAEVQVERALAALSGWAGDRSSLVVRAITPPDIRIPLGDLDQSDRLISLGYNRGRAALERSPIDLGFLGTTPAPVPRIA